MSKFTVVPAGSGHVIHVLGHREEILWDDAANTVFLDDFPSGVGVPMHIHDDMDESCVVVSGRIKFVAGEETIEGGPGDYIHVGKGLPHGFVAIEETRLLWVCAPGGYRGFFEEMAQVPMGPEGPDLGALTAVGQKYGIQLVGPPPTP